MTIDSEKKTLSKEQKKEIVDLFVSSGILKERVSGKVEIIMLHGGIRRIVVNDIKEFK
jgi:hypothetical protein